jgi:hypothetical protein
MFLLFYFHLISSIGEDTLCAREQDGHGLAASQLAEWNPRRATSKNRRKKRNEATKTKNKKEARNAG